MAATRKLQGEIDRCLKKVMEGVETFEDIWQKVHNATNSNQKEKYEADLKKEIKKLQRLRDQIKSWIASAEIKDKSVLMENRKLIETQMERFKVVERETKTKAYSKEGLGAAQKLDPAQIEREKIQTWLVNSIDSLNIQCDTFECEVESLLANKKKKLDKDKQEKMDEFKSRLEKHRFHIRKLETLLRMLDNMSVEVSQIKLIKDDVEYYIESSQDPDFNDNEYLYDDIVGLDEVELSGVGLPTASSATTDSNDTGGTPTSIMSGSSPVASASPPSSSAPLLYYNHSSGDSSNEEAKRTSLGAFKPIKPLPVRASSASLTGSLNTSISTIPPLIPPASSGIMPIPPPMSMISCSTTSSLSLMNNIGPLQPPTPNQSANKIPSLFASSTPTKLLMEGVKMGAGADVEQERQRRDSRESTVSPLTSNPHHMATSAAAAAAAAAANFAAVAASNSLNSSKTLTTNCLESVPVSVILSNMTGSNQQSTSSAATISTVGNTATSIQNHTLSSSCSSVNVSTSNHLQSLHKQVALSSYDQHHVNNCSTSPVLSVVGVLQQSGGGGNPLANSRTSPMVEQQLQQQPAASQVVGMANGPSIDKQISDGMSSLKHIAQQAIDRATTQQQQQQQQSNQLNLLSPTNNPTNNKQNTNPNSLGQSNNPTNSNHGSSVVQQQQSSATSAVVINNNNNSSSNHNNSVNQNPRSALLTTLEASIPPLLGVAPLGAVPLQKEHQAQFQMMEGAYYYMPAAADSERIRGYLSRTPFHTPHYYIQQPLPHSDSLEFYQRLGTESLFFVFYYMEGTKAQYLAAKALKKQSWRFHTKYMMWFQRHEEPKIINEEYEQGTYIYFDYEKWGQRKKEGFTFEYKFLEDRDLN